MVCLVAPTLRLEGIGTRNAEALTRVISVVLESR